LQRLKLRRQDDQARARIDRQAVVLFVRDDRQQTLEPLPPLRSHNTEFGHMRPQRIDRLGPLPHQQVACAMLHQPKRIIVQHRASEESKRVATVPGIGTLGASAVTATVTDPSAFRSGRDFAAWIGLVPRQDSTGGKQKLGPISKQGDRYLRRILVVGAHSVLRRAKQNPEKYPWLTQLLARRPFKVVAIALANKMARIAWALLASGGRYRAPRLAAA
jgi:transposase